VTSRAYTKILSTFTEQRQRLVRLFVACRILHAQRDTNCSIQQLPESVAATRPKSSTAYITVDISFILPRCCAFLNRCFQCLLLFTFSELRHVSSWSLADNKPLPLPLTETDERSQHNLPPGSICIDLMDEFTQTALQNVFRKRNCIHIFPLV
jgi:hypothetical protein